MKKFMILIIISFFFFHYGNTIAQNNDQIRYQPIIEKDGSILLPAQKNIGKSYELSIEPIKNDAWENFEKVNGKWTAWVNKVTGMPHRAFGKPVDIKGYDYIHEGNVDEAAMAFIREHKDVLGIDPDNLKQRRATKVNRLWCVSYSQMYKGIEVMFTEVELRIVTNGTVMAFGVDYYKDINIPVIPKISLNNAKSIAYDGLPFNKNSDKTLSKGEMFILPIKYDGRVDFKLVYQIDVVLNETDGHYKSYVDAIEGEVAFRRNMVLGVETNINVKGMIKLTTPLDPIVEVSFPNQYASISGVNRIADENGLITVDIDSTDEIRAFLMSKWTRTYMNGQSNAVYIKNIEPGDNHTMLWDNTNSTIYERIMFYHTNMAHDFYKAIDPDSKALDFQVNVNIRTTGGTNAVTNLQNGSITFYGATNPNIKFAESPGILYHEYGHTVNQRVFMEQGIANGMINRSCHEGMADVHASFILDDPRLGRGVYTDTNRVVRNIKNNRRYPNNVVINSIHTTGLILAGAFWDLRLTTNLEYARWIEHFSKKIGTPDDANLGVAFGEWLFATLVADDTYSDGDNDLSNGTPRIMEIYEAFNKHGIGTGLLTQAYFKHTKHPDTDNTENPYIIAFEMKTGLESIGGTTDSIFVHYSTDGLNTIESIPADLVEYGKYEALIPAQPRGTFVSYYMTAWDNLTNQKFTFYENAGTIIPYEFMVGYNSALLDDFESGIGWTVGDPEDDATTGLWELAEPKQVLYFAGGYVFEMQRGNDHSDPGTKCFVTDGINPGNSNAVQWQHMPNGKTSIISPVYDISLLHNPLVRYYKWFMNLIFTASPERAAVWEVFASSDGGTTWIKVNSSKLIAYPWTLEQFFAEEFVEKTDQFRVKFTVFAQRGINNIPVGSVTEAMMDDFEILSGNDEIILSVDNNNEGQHQVYSFPNPFNDKTTISYNIDVPGVVELAVYNILGEKIRTLVDEYQTAGKWNIDWDGTDHYGNKVSAGVYMYRLVYGDKIISDKMIVE